MNTLITGMLTAQTATGQNPILGLLPILAFFLVFYLILIVPQKKQRKRHQEMLNQLNPGDKVLTNAGLYGTIVKIEDEKVVLRIADGVKIEYLKSMIAGMATDPKTGEELQKQ